MPLIEWNDSFSVNVSEIDFQHKRPVSMINELNDAMAKGKGKDTIGNIIDGLVSYATTHLPLRKNTLICSNIRASSSIKRNMRIL